MVEKHCDHQEAIAGELVEVVYEAQMEQVAHWAHFVQFLELGTPPFPHQTQEVIPSEVMVVREQQKWREVQEEPWKGQGRSTLPSPTGLCSDRTAAARSPCEVAWA